MKTDDEIRADVLGQLHGNPLLKDAYLVVGVKAGTVTVAGTVDTYEQRFAAQCAVRHLCGIRGAAVEIMVGRSPRGGSWQCTR